MRGTSDDMNSSIQGGQDVNSTVLPYGTYMSREEGTLEGFELTS